MRWRARRPQLKRDPLGSMPMRIQPLLLTTAMLAATATDTTYAQDRKSTRPNSSHLAISYAVFCLKKKGSPFFVPDRHLPLFRSTGGVTGPAAQTMVKAPRPRREPPIPATARCKAGSAPVTDATAL